MLKIKNICLCLLTVVLTSSAWSQEKNIVFLGNGSTGFRFDTETLAPVPYTIHSELNFEGATVVTHPQTGQLLFYSDGNTVYDRNHEPMPNGQNLGACPSSVQAAVVIPKPGHDNQYYLFSNSKGSQCPGSALILSVIDMELRQGFGDIVSTGVLLDGVKEGMTDVLIPNTSNFWLVGNLGTDYTHYVIRIDQTGVSVDSLYQYETDFHTFNFNYHPESGLISSSVQYRIRFFPFDPINGILQPISHQIETPNQRIYDTEMVNESIGYFATIDLDHPGQVYQFDLNDSGAPYQVASTNHRGGGLMHGPDGKIYHIFNLGSTKISVIHNPLGIGANCEYQFAGLELHDRIGTLNFPQLPTFPPPSSDGAIRGIINKYAKVSAVTCNSLWIEHPENFSVGDTILLVQMQGASYHVENTADFGSLLDIESAGLHEMNVISEISGNEVTLERVLTNEYNTATGVLQMVDIPYLGDAVLDGVTCLPWNGSYGGILAFSGGTITLTDDLDVSGRGFRGGQVMNDPDGVHDEVGTEYFYPADSIDAAGMKGEGIAVRMLAFLRGMAALLNGGGGGNEHNCGGGGGACFGLGGQGDYWQGFEHIHISAIGKGGYAIPLDLARVFLGGGGGAGHSNNLRGQSGGNGGGIIFIAADRIIPDGHIIRANGESVGIAPDNIDGGGGGGGGGTVILDLAPTQIHPLTIEARGGNGGSIRSNHGHGGGGGGGGLFLNQYPIGQVLFNALGGRQGRVAGETLNLAEPGTNGAVQTQYEIPFSTEIYEPLALTNTQVIAECDSTGTIMVTASGTDLQLSLNGAPFVTDTIFDGLVSGSYRLIASNGCEELERVVEVNNYPPVDGEVFFLMPAICDSLGAVEVVALHGQEPFTYEVIGRPDRQADGFFEQLPVGSHTIAIADQRGCLQNVTFTVPDESYNMEIYLPDTTLQQYDTIQLAPTIYPENQITEYRWFPASIMDCTDCPRPSFFPNYSSTIKLEAVDEYGCSGSAEGRIDVIDIGLFIPTAFSPNADGNNDRFTVFSKDGAIKEVKVLRILDRWGSIVFEKFNFQPNDEHLGWDGTIQSKVAAKGVYICLGEVLLNNGARQPFVGEVMLIR